MTPDERTLHAQLHAALAAGDHATVATITDLLDAEDAARIQRLTAPGALLSSALYYAKAGIPVFPLEVGIGYDRDGKPNGKKPLFKRAHPKDAPSCYGRDSGCDLDGHGLYDATTDIDKVRAWWSATPQANIGVRTGQLFTVIDVDMPDGYLSLGEMRDKGLIPAVHGRVITASGGTHLYVPPTGDGNATGILPGIDVRGVGGYCVAPPSRCEEGLWLWTVPLDLDALRQGVTA